MAQVHSTVTYKAIPGFPGYRVGDDGSVWSSIGSGGRQVKAERPWKLLKPNLIRNRSRKVVSTQVLLTPGKNHRLVHRLVLEAFVGPCPDGMEGCHNDGNAANNTLANLRWDTRSANVVDAYRHGTLPHGEGHHRAKMTAGKVRTMRGMWAAGTSMRELARRFGVTHQNVAAIVARKTWKHV